MQSLLADRTCLVTEASRGIGRGIVEDLGAHGAEVVVNYRSSEAEAYDVVDAIEDEGGSAIAVQGDVADLEPVEGTCERVQDAFGRVDVLLDNAGITVDGEFGNTTRADRGRVIDVNLGGVSDCTHCPFEDVRGSEQGRPINDSSVAGQRGNCGRTDHATTGSGPSGSTRIVVLGSARSGSTADHVAPAFVRTDTLETVPDRVKRRTVDRVPLGRFAEVEDVGGIVRFLASEAYTTGQILAINGGVER